MKNIKDYAFIGDSNSAALVGKDGSIDWCCIPFFDSAPIFSALLDQERSGYFAIQPKGYFESSQAYIPQTNVVETTFISSTGKMILRDAFAVRTEEEKKHELFPDHEILRIVTCISGEMVIKMDYLPKIYYGKTPVRFDGKENFGFKFKWKEHIFILQSDLKYHLFYTPPDKSSAHVEFKLRKGESAIFSLSYSCQNPAIIPEVKTTAVHRMERSVRYWKEWLTQCTYSGPFQTEVERSLLALKLMAHAPSGAIVAAPTTSLPEEIGGVRNWDYRYCWLRDASFTVRSLIHMGFEHEAKAFMDWTLHATRLTFPELQVVYTVFGHARIKERSIPWLSGFRNSKPVNIGNGAYSQFQLDVYGEVIDAFYSYSNITSYFDKGKKHFIVTLAKKICEIWKEPDDGIWEARAGKRHHTHSKVMAWVGLDRTIRIAQKFEWENVPLDRFRAVRDEIRNDIERKGFNQEIQSYTQVYGKKDLDACLLVMPIVEFCDAIDERMQTTVKAIESKLKESGFIYRYKADDGLTGDEGTFIICTFWYIEVLAQMGKVEEAKACFQAVCDCAGPTGLLSEEIETNSLEMIGNYPQAFSHIGLINAALSIQKAMSKNEEL